MDLASGFKIVFFSHPDYEHLTAEIYYGEKFVALITQENECLQIELPPVKDGNLRLNVAEFLEAIQSAGEKLCGGEPVLAVRS